MVDRQERYLYMIEILNKKGECLEVTTIASKHREDTVIYNLHQLVNIEKYDVKLLYLGIQNKPRRLRKLEPANL